MSVAAKQAAIARKNKTKLSWDDKLYYAIVGVVLFVLTLSVLYPLIYIVSASFSEPAAVSSGQVVLLPVGFSVEGYKRVLAYERVYTGFRNSIFYTCVGTLINVCMTMICAYPLAKPGLPFKGPIMFLFSFTMLFSGGMIPSYLLMRDLHLLNTPWVMVIPGAIAVYQMIVTRTYIQSSIPGEMMESAMLDGCDDFQYFFRFVLPLSVPVIAVIAMQYAVGHWNAYFDAFIYLTDNKLYPLQVFLREVLIQSQIEMEDYIDEETAMAMQGMADLLKYSLIVVSTVPILAVYPFAQKYFVRGIMVGSLKG